MMRSGCLLFHYLKGPNVYLIFKFYVEFNGQQISVQFRGEFLGLCYRIDLFLFLSFPLMPEAQF